MLSGEFRLHIPRELIVGDKKIKEEDDVSTVAGGEPEEGMGMVHGRDDDDVDSEDDLQQIGELQPSTSKSRTSVSTTSSRRRSTLDMDDYLYGPQKSIQRRRADPRVCRSILGIIFGNCC
ncbi:unnamed protein product [Anisakis simplex]|uniref:Uncharacterized protein n=1 Tax=Anisakis simplex TaxID=6269 RepID=A0A0M3JHX5_ANISI|nr:unnamed protein product [Anisakis simplex]